MAVSGWIYSPPGPKAALPLTGWRAIGQHGNAWQPLVTHNYSLLITAITFYLFILPENQSRKWKCNIWNNPYIILPAVRKHLQMRTEKAPKFGGQNSLNRFLVLIWNTFSDKMKREKEKFLNVTIIFQQSWPTKRQTSSCLLSFDFSSKLSSRSHGDPSREVL